MVDLTLVQIGELFFLVFFFLSTFLVIRAIMTFITQRANLKLRVTEIDAELELLRPRLPDIRDRVTLLRHELPRLNRERQRIADYQYKLRQLERDVQERERQSREQDGAPQEQRPSTEIRVHQTGFEL